MFSRIPFFFHILTMHTPLNNVCRKDKKPMAQFTNQASISYNGITVNSNIVTGEITEVLSAWKRASASSYREGDIITYIVNIQNSGTTPYTNLTITDDLGAYEFGTGTTVTPLVYTGEPVIYSVNGQLQTAPAVTAGPPLVISGITVPAGQSSEVIYRARVNNFAPLGTGAAIDNTATVTGGGLTEAVTADETVTSNSEPVLAIFKELSPSTVVENGQVSYTFTIQNTGTDATDTGDNLVITDVFTPILNAPLTVTLNGAPWEQTGNYTYDEDTGTFTTVAGSVTVPGATYTQDSTTGAWTSTPGVTTITVTGTI